jgi:5,6,7,8-tetrahydromethanopterin hydro-lyase
VITPNLAVKPATVLVTKVTIKGMKQAVQMFGPAQAAVAKAVADSVAGGVIPQNKCEDLVIVCGVFIHPAASDDKKIYQYNYEATKLAIKSAMEGKPTAQEMIAGKEQVHPFRGF